MSIKNRFTTLSEMSKIKSGLLIFFIAFIFRIFVLNNFNTNSIYPDGTGYHRIAYNISEGKGYSLIDGEKYFFREPAYPVFLSLSFEISKLLGNKSEHLVLNKDLTILNKACEITIAKYMQALLDSFTCVICYLLLAGILKQKYSLLIAALLSLYFSYAYNVTYILREPLQTFFGIAMSYSLMLYFKHNKTKYLIVTGVLWGLLNLTFQASLIFVVTIPLFIWIYQRHFIKALIPSIIVVLSMMVTVSPWLIRSYYSFPDIRILKSFGTSLTPEYRNYIGTVKKATYYGLITEKQENIIDVNDFLALSEADKFRVSWDGTLTRKADSLNSLIREPLITKRKAMLLPTNLRNSTPQTFAGPIMDTKPVLAILLILPITLLCLLAIIGFIRFFPYFFKINIFFITYFSIFIIIADEKRRMFPIQPFIFIYGIMGIIYLYYRYYKKIDNTSIKELLILK